MNVLVCGTQYGSTYLRALSLSSTVSATPLKLIGILSKGSQRSQTLAQQMGVPHYTQLSQLSGQNIDIACVAVSGEAGQKLVLELLSKGVAVICEHPVDPDFVQLALATAQEHNTALHVNSHFADLQAPQAFLQSLWTAYQQGQPCIHMDLAFNLRTLYSGLDMLGRSLGSLSDIEVGTLSSSQANTFATLYLQSRQTSVSILCQNFSSAEDDGSATYLNHRLSAIFPHGTLLLSETTGPLSWFPTMNSMSAQHWKTYIPVDLQPMSQAELIQQRDYCNLNALHTLVSVKQGNDGPIYQAPEYLVSLSKLWHQLINQFASLHKVEGKVPNDNPA